jgi:hypothetical protein
MRSEGIHMNGLDLTPALAKVVGGSVLLPAIIFAYYALRVQTSNVYLKGLTLVVSAVLVIVSIVMFTANQKVKTDEVAQKQARDCAVLLAKVETRLDGKLLHSVNLHDAKAITREALRDIRVSDCKP